MSSHPTTVTSHPTLNLEQLLNVIRQLDLSARTKVAQVLLETELDAKLSALIRRLTERPSVDEISDETLRNEMATHGVQLWGIDTLLEKMA